MAQKTHRGLVALVVILLILAGFMAYYRNLPLRAEYRDTSGRILDSSCVGAVDC